MSPKCALHQSFALSQDALYMLGLHSSDDIKRRDILDHISIVSLSWILKSKRINSRSWFYF